MRDTAAARAPTQAARVGVALALLLVASAALAADVPALSGRVVDGAAILAPATREQLTATLAAHEQSTGNQIAVLTTPTLGGEPIEDYATRAFAAWRLGQRGKDNGVLLVVVPGDRKMRIEVGYGLEAALPDAAAGRIIDDVMKPRFKAGDYDGGISDGVTAIIATLEGRAEATTRPAKRNRFAPVDMPLKGRLIIAAVVLGILGLFTFGGIMTASPGGWVLYVFLTPFWTLFPMPLFGVNAGWAMLGVHLVGFPIVRAALARTDWYAKMRSRAESRGTDSSGGFGSSGGDSSSFDSSSGGGGGDFSGGGGSSGGGGASGSW